MSDIIIHRFILKVLFVVLKRGRREKKQGSNFFWNYFEDSSVPPVYVRTLQGQWMLYYFAIQISFRMSCFSFYKEINRYCSNMLKANHWTLYVKKKYRVGFLRSEVKSYSRDFGLRNPPQLLMYIWDEELLGANKKEGFKPVRFTCDISTLS